MGGGKGAYYKAKYGGGGKGGGKGSRGDVGGDLGHDHGGDGGGASAEDTHSAAPWRGEDVRASTKHELQRRLRDLEGRQYPQYRSIEGYSYDCDGYSLILDKAQTDPFAPASRMRVCAGAGYANYPKAHLTSKTRRVALADFICRKFWEKVHATGLDEIKQSANYHAAKGGELNIERPSQHVLERTSCVVLPSGVVEVRFQLSLPGRGRSILGEKCADLMCVELARIVQATIPFRAHLADEVKTHVDCVEDQEYLRSHLAERGLIAFVANGAILPRRGGDDDRPMEGARGSGTRPVLFQSPPSLEVTVEVPHRGKLKGMGIKPGVTLIVGGGFHGKSTLLRALEVGIYNHVPGDGREFVVAFDDAVKIRAEDKRSVQNVDISCFLNNLPMGKATDTFSTQDASGSTSQASNIMEALEVGCSTILIDEDTCATNFMIRDYRMQLLVAKNKEPITPFILKVRQMFADLKVSSICVVGGAGAYLEVADTVIMMDSYVPKDVTAEAKAIVDKIPNHMSEKERVSESGESFGRVAQRIPGAKGVKDALSQPKAKVTARTIDTLSFGSETIDLGFVEQLVEKGQVAAIGDWIQTAAMKLFDDQATVRQVLSRMQEKMDADDGCAMDRIRPQWMAPHGSYSRPRKQEVAAALNRLRTMRFAQKS